MKFRLEKIRQIERLRTETSKRSLALAASAETAAREAATGADSDEKKTSAERDGAIRPGERITEAALFDRRLFSNRVLKARRILMTRVFDHSKSERALDDARLEYASKRRRLDGLDRLRDRFESGRKRVFEKAEESDADDLSIAARRV